MVIMVSTPTPLPRPRLVLIPLLSMSSECFRTNRLDHDGHEPEPFDGRDCIVIAAYACRVPQSSEH